MHFFTSQIINVTQYTDSIFEFVLQLADDTSLVAGQFVNIKIPHDNSFVVRAYSLCDFDNQAKSMTLRFRRIDGGIATSYLAKLSRGDTIEYIGPFGDFVFPQDVSDVRDIYFLGKETGLIPFLCLLSKHLADHPDKKFHMILSVLEENKDFYHQQLQKYESDYSHFSFDFSYFDKRNTCYQAVLQTAQKLSLTANSLVYISGDGTVTKLLRAFCQATSIMPQRILCEPHNIL